jgi:hypothetical protein
VLRGVLAVSVLLDDWGWGGVVTITGVEVRGRTEEFGVGSSGGASQ